MNVQGLGNKICTYFQNLFSYQIHLLNFVNKPTSLVVLQNFITILPFLINIIVPCKGLLETFQSFIRNAWRLSLFIGMCSHPNNLIAVICMWLNKSSIAQPLQLMCSYLNFIQHASTGSCKLLIQHCGWCVCLASVLICCIIPSITILHCMAISK